MCGRFLFIAENELMDILAEAQANLEARGIPRTVKTGEIFPTNLSAIIAGCEERRKTKSAFWGFTNALEWENLKRMRDGKKPLKPKAVFNTRAETAATNRFWKDSLLNRRCLIPTSGFYEWQHIGKDEKQEFLFTLPGSPVTMVAGIWRDERYDPLETNMTHFSMLTTQPNESVVDVHDRMPVVLRPEEYDQWLTGDYTALFDRREVSLKAQIV